MSASWARTFQLEDGKAAAQLCAINLLAQLKAACGGDLDRVRALREARRLRQRHARFHPASRSGQWRLRPVRGGVRRCRQACPRRRRRGLAAARRGRGSGRGVRDRSDADHAWLRPARAEIGADAWKPAPIRKARPSPHPFTRYEFFAALEESGSATRAHRLAAGASGAGRSGAVQAFMPLYLKSHSQGEYVFDHAWADALERAGGDYYPKLQCSVPFTPVTGPRILARDGQGTARLLLKAGKAATRPDRRLVAAHHLSHRGGMGSGGRAQAICCAPTSNSIGTIAAIAISTQFLGELSSAKRKNLRKERAAVREAGVEIRLADRQRHHRSPLGPVLRILHGYGQPQMGPSLSHPRILQPHRREHGGPDPAGHGAAGRRTISPAR